MKIKKRYIIACVLLCIAAVALSIGVFNFEMGFARYSKLNSVTKKTWIETSASEVGNRVNSDFFITTIKNVDEVEGAKTFDYIGQQHVISGKYICYNKESWGDDILVNGKNSKTGEDYKVSDRITVFYKPDNPRLIYVPTSCTPYVVLLAVSFVFAVGLVIACKIINKSLRENTFNENTVTIMDIPMLVVLAGFVLSFVAGLIIGNVQVNATYTVINQTIADLIASGEVTF